MSTGKMTKEKLVENRQQEIIRACEELYERMEYDEINIKEIAKSTSICRSNIYNYYETKDEIFLDILKKEYLLWMEDMDRRMRKDKDGGRESYCRILAETAGGHPQLLKLISMNYIAIERNCSLEKLTAFKRELLPFRDMMRDALGKYFPNASEERKEHFLLALLSLMQGLYSMTNLTEKQLEAMKRVNPDYVQPDFEKNFCQALFSLSAELI